MKEGRKLNTRRKPPDDEFSENDQAASPLDRQASIHHSTDMLSFSCLPSTPCIAIYKSITIILHPSLSCFTSMDPSPYISLASKFTYRHFVTVPVNQASWISKQSRELSVKTRTLHFKITQLLLLLLCALVHEDPNYVQTLSNKYLY